MGTLTRRNTLDSPAPHPPPSLPPLSLTSLPHLSPTSLAPPTLPQLSPSPSFDHIVRIGADEMEGGSDTASTFSAYSEMDLQRCARALL